VHRDVPAHALVLGNPGRLMGKVCYCGQRLVANDFCASCNKTLEEVTDHD
jgi:UDP-2-acetamido-3-amino-2,3-dideoxy-glucuronate N-acetyltransferase